MDKLQEKILDVTHNQYYYLMNLQNVIGVGLGYKRINNFDTVEPCIHVLVENKIDSKYIPFNNLIPKNYMGIKTDIIEVGNMDIKNVDMKISNKKIRPLQGGYGMSVLPKGFNPKSGTITCVVTRVSKGKTQYFVLGNNHVLAGVNKFQIGSTVIQPAIEDGGTLSDKVGTLKYYVPIKEYKPYITFSNEVDCAIVEINKTLASDIIRFIGKVKGVGKPTLGLSVEKIGKMTGLTKGKIITIGVTIKIKFLDSRSAVFKNQFIADTYSVRGDSGAPFLNKDEEIVGLLLSGNEEKKTSTFNDINLVLKALKVNVYVL